MSEEPFKVKFISAEGNVGSGKSTLVAAWQKIMGDNDNFMFIQEPVKEWEGICDDAGNSMLQKFYADQQRWSFPFQMMAYISRLALLREAAAEADRRGIKYIVSERCVDTDKHVFAQMLYDDGKLDTAEFAIYNRWYDLFLKDIPVHSRIYIETSPAVCEQRVIKRARPGEVIPLEYLEKCHHYHENWLSSQKSEGIPILSLDGNKDMYDDPNIMKTWLTEVQSFLGDVNITEKLTKTDNTCLHTS